MKKQFISTKIARIISTVFIPPVNLMYLFIYLGLHFETKIENSYFVIAVALLLGFIFPIALFFYLMKKDRISDEDTTNKKERQVPYFFSALFAFTAIVITFSFHSNAVIIIAWISYFINTIFLVSINKYWKISAHAIGIASPWAIILYFNIMLFPIFAIIIILVGWSRLKLKVHNIYQIVAGSILGFCLTLIELIIGLKLVG